MGRIREMNKKINILQYGGGWITNIGNAFIDLGSISCLHKAIVNSDIHLVSSSNKFVSSHVHRWLNKFLIKKRGVIKNFLNLQNYADIDYVVQSGSCLSKNWFHLYGDILIKLSQKGVKVIINGGGISEGAYSEEEIEETRKYIRDLKPYVFISRDIETYESFKDLSEFSYNGIDCGFWISDAYTPIKLDIPEYIVLNFDKEPEPKNLSLNLNKLIIRTHHSFWLPFPIRNHLKMIREYYDRNNIMISDLPYEYLDLYANASVTYSDRVHACVAALSYGNQARLFRSTFRALLFERIGLNKITEKITTLNIKKINIEKQKQINFLSEILNK